MEDANSQLEQAESEKTKSEDTIRQQKEELTALTMLWQLEKTYRSGDYDGAREIISEMDLTYGHSALVSRSKEPLTNDAAAEYEDICNALSE